MSLHRDTEEGMAAIQSQLNRDSPDDSQLTQIFALFRPCCKTNARCGWLQQFGQPERWSSRLIWPFSLASGHIPPVDALERVTIECFMLGGGGAVGFGVYGRGGGFGGGCGGGGASAGSSGGSSRSASGGHPRPRAGTGAGAGSGMGSAGPGERSRAVFLALAD